ncbi:MAG: hypothetical protein U1F57_12290 [bacterium]
MPLFSFNLNGNSHSIFPESSETLPIFPRSSLSSSCDIPTSNPQIFLCRSPEPVKWNPLLNNNINDYLRDWQAQVVAEAMLRPEPLYPSERHDWVDGAVSLFRSIGRQLRNMRYGIDPPPSPEEVALGLGGAMFGCSRRRPSTPGPTLTVENLRSEGIRRVQTDLPGDPRVGTVIFIRQAHYSRWDLEEDFLRRDPQAYLRHQYYTEAYQWEILKFLEALQPRHVFSEGLDRNLTNPNEVNHYLSTALERAEIEPLQESLVGPLPPRPQGELLEIIIHHEAVNLYALRHPQLQWHQVMTNAESLIDNLHYEAYSQCVLRNEEGCSERDEAFVMATRESWASRELMQFLRAHPGETAVLIYGAAHQFCDDLLRENFRPRVISVSFDVPNSPYHTPFPGPCGER